MEFHIHQFILVPFFFFFCPKMNRFMNQQAASAELYSLQFQPWLQPVPNRFQRSFSSFIFSFPCATGPALQPELKAVCGRTLCVYFLCWSKKKKKGDLSPLSEASAPSQGKKSLRWREDGRVGGGVLTLTDA